MIRLLRDDDAEAYLRLRRAALRETPLTFGASPDDDVISSAEAVRQQLARGPDTVILGAFDVAGSGAGRPAAAGAVQPAVGGAVGPALVGAVGLYRDRHRKASHKAHLWGMYVLPDHRRRGVGARLLAAALEHARALSGIEWVHLGVSTAAPGARRLYERAGFEVWGVEPHALRHEGQQASEVHMALQLRPDRRATDAVRRTPPEGRFAVLAISGSLRAGSSNAMLLQAAAQLAPARMRVQWCTSIGRLPLFNPDLDGPVALDAVADFRAQVAASDGLMISSPEYAHGVPGALKNALDWLVSGVEILGKPIALLSAGNYSTYAHDALRETLTAMATSVVPEACVALPVSGRGLDAAAICGDPQLAGPLRRALEALATAMAERRRTQG